MEIYQFQQWPLIKNDTVEGKRRPPWKPFSTKKKTTRRVYKLFCRPLHSNSPAQTEKAPPIAHGQVFYLHPTRGQLFETHIRELRAAGNHSETKPIPLALLPTPHKTAMEYKKLMKKACQSNAGNPTESPETRTILSQPAAVAASIRFFVPV